MLLLVHLFADSQPEDMVHVGLTRQLPAHSYNKQAHIRTHVRRICIVQEYKQEAEVIAKGRIQSECTRGTMLWKNFPLLTSSLAVGEAGPTSNTMCFEFARVCLPKTAFRSL